MMVNRSISHCTPHSIEQVTNNDWSKKMGSLRKFREPENQNELVGKFFGGSASAEFITIFMERGIESDSSFRLFLHININDFNHD